MGEIIIKVPGDVREEFTLGVTTNAEDLKENIEKITRRLKNLLFLTFYFPKIKHSIEIEETSEEEMYLQGD